MRASNLALSAVLAFLSAFAPGAAVAQECSATNGTFRFLNNTFPTLSTNGPPFTGQLVVANADGPVTFSEDPSSADSLADFGLELDPASGLITGLADQSGNRTVTFRADDGTQFVTHEVEFSVSSSGGGGNGGSGLDNPVFPDGRVGDAYSHTPDPGGDGPYIFGASDLPPGLSLNGATGEVSGTPSAAGTFYITYTVYDLPGNTEENIAAAVVPITIHPDDLVEPLDDYNFEFATRFLNNGEVGTPFCDQYEVTGAAVGGTLSFGASGLPDGLALDPATGAVTGTPTEAGTFVVTLSANDGTSTITTNLSMIIAADSSSDFHWNFLGVPAALVNTLYETSPNPIVLTAEGGAGTITYAAMGLPAGITYNASTGELAGTPTLMGEYPVTFSACDGPVVDGVCTGDEITLDFTFVVLPATGGDVSQITVNFWVTKATLKLGADGAESWKASAIYNADRRTGNRFDPATGTFKAVLGSRTLQVDPGECVGNVPDQACAFKTPSGEVPVESLKLTPDKQAAAWSTGSDTIAESVPGVLTQTVSIGDHSYRLKLRFDEKGAFRAALGFERAAFVLSKGAILVKGPGLDSAKLSLLLADPNLTYDATTSTLRVRILEGSNVLLDRDFSALRGLEKETVDSKTLKTVFSFKTLKDAALTDTVAMAYSSSKGALKLTLTNLDLSGIPSGEAHLGFEVTIDDRVYTTFVTFFETSEGKYGLAIP